MVGWRNNQPVYDSHYEPGEKKPKTSKLREIFLTWLKNFILKFLKILIFSKSVYAFDALFWPILSTVGYKTATEFAKDIKIFEYDIVFFPVCENSHWILAVYFKNTQKLAVLDSYGIRHEKIEKKLFRFLSKEWEKEHVSPREFIGGIDTELIKILPKQNNFSDCGVFILLYAETLGKDLKIRVRLGSG